MTYTIGDKKINIDGEELSEGDRQLIAAHLQLFKVCLNNASFKFLLHLKKIVHLYCDIVTIYSTLLRKVLNYDDITAMTSATKVDLLRLEEDFNAVFGPKMNSSGSFSKLNWELKSYENDIKTVLALFLKSTIENFDLVIRNLNCIDIFFNSFDNLKKLLIPFLLNQTRAIHKLLLKALYLFKLHTAADDVEALIGAEAGQLLPSLMKHLRKIEKITTGIERELIILNTAFLTFDPSLQQYTSILLGKAILKRDISRAECQIIRRREVCFQAAEHVVSIPLTEDKSTNLLMRHFTKYVTYVGAVVALIVVLVLYRLFKVLVW